MHMNPEHPERRIEALEEENRKILSRYRELAEKAWEYKHFIENTRDAIVIFDHELLLLHTNPAAVRLLGYAGRSDIDRVGIECVFARPDILDDLLYKLLSHGAVDHFETTLCQKNPDKEKPEVIGSGFSHLDSRGRIKHLEFIFTDITESKKMQQRLQQSQKMEAIGTLAGGVAHDFNNLLMGIQGRVNLLSLDLPPMHFSEEHIGAILEYIKSGAELTRQLLGIARDGKYEAKPIDFNELVKKSSTMFARTKKEIRIHTRLREKPLVVEADQGRIERVLLNMYVNALQAMPGGGELHLVTSAVILDESFCNPYQMEPGHYGKLSITDTGIGMDGPTRRRIFDPFFTTKEKGRGTGLGLASAYGIIKNHGGMITVYSEVGRGTTFNVYLPLSDKKVAPVIRISGEAVKGSETILLVDDEDKIVEVNRALLERLGYRILTAEGGTEAVRTVETMGDDIDLIILDLIMPGMDGAKAFERIRDVRPGIPIILSSGYAVSGKAEEIMRKGCEGFMQKPFDIIELSVKIRKTLDAKKSRRDGVEKRKLGS